MPSASHAVNRTKVSRLAALDDLEVLEADLEGHAFPVHFHGTYVLQWVTGGADFCHIAGLTARSGQLFVHGPGTPHAGAAAGSTGLRYVACYPSKKLVAQCLGAAAGELPDLGTAVGDSKALGRSTEALFCALLPANSEGAIRSGLREVMLRLFDSRGGMDWPDEPNVPAPGLLRAQRHLVRFSHRGVPIEELSEVAGLSRFHLVREFKRALGITPHQYLISERVSKARRLLARGMPIAEAAAAMGFADQSHMTRTFKKVTAFPPGRIESLDA